MPLVLRRPQATNRLIQNLKFKIFKMIARKQLNIGLFGFGCVGKGLYDVLAHTAGLKANIKKICVKQANKKREILQQHFTLDRYELLDDDSINVIVELIDDADAAFEIVSYALRKGKAVVSANKKMIAEHFDELRELQKQYDVPFLYEGAACASIPVIRNFEEYYDNDLLTSVEGIVNGSTNYILTKLYEEGKPYADVLKEAQLLGFAESNPALDVEAYDPRYKLSLLAAHAFGNFVSPELIFKYGINSIGEADIQYAKEKGYKVKLVAHALKNRNELGLWVIPQFIPQGHNLYHIDREYNGVSVEGVFSDKQFFSGKGAGSYPTASAVLSDISALTYDYRYEYKKLNQKLKLDYTNDIELKLYCRYPTGTQQSDLPFISIEQSFASEELKYVIGTARLSDLANSFLLDNEGVFLAQVGERVEFPVSVNRKEVVEEGVLIFS
jgi:homoserine dehydrogenase